MQLIRKGFVNCSCDVVDGISRWSEIFIESMQAINNSLRQPFIIPSPISHYWYAGISWMSLTELANCLVTHNSIKTFYKYSCESNICSLCQQIWPKFWEVFSSQKMYGFWWFSSRHDWSAIPETLLNILEEKWWTSKGNVKHYIRAILHIVKED